MPDLFGDGQGSISDGANVDMMHVHNLNSGSAVDAIFEGLANPGAVHRYLVWQP